MRNGRVLWTAVLCISVLSPCGLSAGSATKIPKQDRAWKQYRNERLGYCVSYPSRWMRDHGYDNMGLFVRTGLTKFSANPSGGIDVSVQERPGALGRAVSLDLNDNLQFHLDGMVKFQRVQQIQVMEKRPMTIGDSPALFMKDQYYDPLERSSWVEEVIWASRNDQLYRLELVCRSSEAQRFERVFQRVVDSFSFRCSETH